MKHSLISFILFRKVQFIPRNWTMLWVVFRLGHSWRINYGDQCRGLCTQNVGPVGCAAVPSLWGSIWLPHIKTFTIKSNQATPIKTVFMGACHRKLGICCLICSCCWEFPENKGWLSSIRKSASWAVWRICVWDYMGLLTRCVSKVVCRDDFSQNAWLRIFIQAALAGILVSFIH